MLWLWSRTRNQWTADRMRHSWTAFQPMALCKRTRFHSLHIGCTWISYVNRSLSQSWYLFYVLASVSSTTLHPTSVVSTGYTLVQAYLLHTTQWRSRIWSTSVFTVPRQFATVIYIYIYIRVCVWHCLLQRDKHLQSRFFQHLKMVTRWMGLSAVTATIRYATWRVARWPACKQVFTQQGSWTATVHARVQTNRLTLNPLID